MVIPRTYQTTLVPPGLNLAVDDLEHLIPFDHKFIIVGDFNSKHHIWNNGPSNQYGNAIYKWLLNNDIILLNDNKTATYQCASTGSTSTLDLSFCSSNIYDNFKNWCVGEDLSSDHLPVYVTFSFSTNNSPDNMLPKTKWKIKSANWCKFHNETTRFNNFNDETTMSQKAIESRTSEITDIIVTAAKQSIPTIKQRSCRPMNIWWNNDLTCLRKHQQSARRQWMKTRTVDNKIKYNKARANLRRSILEAKRTSWQQFVGSLSPNTPPTVVWKRFKAIEGKSYEHITHLKDNNQIITEDTKKAELLNSHYVQRLTNNSSWPKYMTKQEQYLTSNFHFIFHHNDITDNAFTIEEINLAISELHNSATGEDEIHNSMLLNSSEKIRQEILNLFNNIWKTGFYPKNWKNATIIPILKPGKDKLDPKSYRPISLTSCISKLLERIVHRRLTWRLETFNLLSPYQFGFRPSCGTTEALLYFAQEIYKGFTEKKITLAVMIDFEAAFDSTPHKSILLQSMKLGIKGRMLRFLHSYLNERTIQTTVNNHLSSTKKITGGIPQGSVLSPDLFNIMLHDLPDVVPPEVRISIYADDVTIWATDNDPDKTLKAIQTAVDNINTWASKWNLSISQSKTECTVFTRRYSLKNYKPHIYLNNQEIQYNPTPKILGLIFDEKLLWKTHISNVVSLCLPRLNLLKIIANKEWGSDITTMRLLYIAYIRSKLTYGCEIWGGASTTHLQKISVFQNSALRLCLGVPKTTSTVALEIECNIQPIKHYIMRKDLKIHLKLQASSRAQMFFKLSDNILYKFYKTNKEEFPVYITDTLIAKTPVVNEIR